MQESLNTLINMFSCSENGVSSIDTTSLNMTLKNLVSTTAELGEDITKLKDLIGYLNIYSEFIIIKCIIYIIYNIIHIIYNRYYKLGLSTQNESDLERRPNTYSRYSEFLVKHIIPKAKSTQQGKKYERYLFKLLQNNKNIKWIDVDNKESNRGINISYISV
jgi:hypothetical protein